MIRRGRKRHHLQDIIAAIIAVHGDLFVQRLMNTRAQLLSKMSTEKGLIGTEGVEQEVR